MIGKNVLNHKILVRKNVEYTIDRKKCGKLYYVRKEAANETICHGTITKLERKGKKKTHDYYGRKTGGKNMVNEGIRMTIFPQSGICILL